MKAKPEQDLSLLPGDYYHPEAELEVTLFPDGTPELRGHYLHGEPHGIWESYRPEGTLWRRGHYLKGEKHGAWENYHRNGNIKERGHYLEAGRHGLEEKYYEDGTINKLQLWYQGTIMPFLIEVLLGESTLKLFK
jgi:antitoxin component YwqK of YwqJK toxin-antitoxin module